MKCENCHEQDAEHHACDMHLCDECLDAMLEHEGSIEARVERRLSEYD